MVSGYLDPLDWQVFHSAAQRGLTASIEALRTTSDRKVWKPLSQDLRKIIEQPLPRMGCTADEIVDNLLSFMPYGVGNTHPRFFGWVHGAGTPGGILAEIIAASMNVNAGGRNHIAPVVERQVIKWCTEVMGFGANTSGLIVSGTSMATIIALKVARDQALSVAQSDGMLQGNQRQKLVGYASEQAHTCIAQAFDILGLGKDNLRKVACNADFEIDIVELKSLIASDKKAGFRPFVVIATAGTVNMGAFDDLDAVANISAREGLWFHVDGAFGACVKFGKRLADKVAGIDRADSLAFDFHKWLQVNYDAGCVLIKNQAAHRQSFANRPEYLRGFKRGLAGGAFWAVDYGPELSRGFRALKVWAHFVEHGLDKLGAMIDDNIDLARYLAARITSEEQLQPLAPVALNINCFRYLPAAGTYNAQYLDALNQEIIVRLQEQGIAVPSSTRLRGRLAIRVNITNHRTQKSDLDLFVDALLKIAKIISVDFMQK